jgi:hypothetical protein
MPKVTVLEFMDDDPSAIEIAQECVSRGKGFYLESKEAVKLAQAVLDYNDEDQNGLEDA